MKKLKLMSQRNPISEKIDEVTETQSFPRPNRQATFIKQSYRNCVLTSNRQTVTVTCYVKPLIKNLQKLTSDSRNNYGTLNPI